MPVSRHEFCCGCLPIFSGICAIVFHGFVHSIYAFCLILSSYYRPRDDAINYFAVTGYVLLLIIGLPVLCVVVLQRTRGIKFCGFIFLLIAVYNTACAIAYFAVYFPFKANSLLDKAFLWRYDTKWVSSEKFPLAIWHLLTGLLVLIAPLWFYYTYVILIYPSYLQVLRSEEPTIPEIIVLENRLGPLGSYRPPQGYPYSTNQPPGFTNTNGVFSAPYHPSQRMQEKRVEANPLSILD